MRQIFSTLRQVFHKRLLILGLISLLGLSSLLMIDPSHVAMAAGNQQAAQEKPINVLDYVEAPANREEAYEEATEAAETPKQVVKTEKKEIQAFKKSEKGNDLAEGAQNLVDKVTGKS